MSDPLPTRWSLIRRAARGDAPPRTEFARDYEPIIRAYLASRWRRSRLLGEIDDATDGSLNQTALIRRKIAELLPNTRWEEIPRCGHVVYLEKPQQFFGMIKTFMAAKDLGFSYEG